MTPGFCASVGVVIVSSVGPLGHSSWMSMVTRIDYVPPPRLTVAPAVYVSDSSAVPRISLMLNEESPILLASDYSAVERAKFERLARYVLHFAGSVVNLSFKSSVSVTPEFIT
jgi:hypothetical protein